jgi:hypothetical protein
MLLLNSNLPASCKNEFGFSLCYGRCMISNLKRCGTPGCLAALRGTSFNFTFKFFNLSLEYCLVGLHSYSFRKHPVVCFSYPGKYFGVSFLWVTDPHSMDDHSIPVTRRLKLVGSFRPLELGANIETI